MAILAAHRGGKACRTGREDPRRGEVGYPDKVDGRLAELVARRGHQGRLLHTCRTVDRHVGQFRCEVHVEVVRQPEVAGLGDDEPDGSRPIRTKSLVQREGRRALVEIHLEQTLDGEVLLGEKAAVRGVTALYGHRASLQPSVPGGECKRERKARPPTAALASVAVPCPLLSRRPVVLWSSVHHEPRGAVPVAVGRLSTRRASGDTDMPLTEVRQRRSNQLPLA